MGRRTGPKGELVSRNSLWVRMLSIVAAVSAGSSLGACGGSSHKASTPTTAPTSPTTASPSPTSAAPPPTTASPIGGRAFHLTNSFTTSDGYSFTVTASGSLGTPATGDSSQLPPGQDALVLPVSGSESIKNTTPGGRDYSGDPVDHSTLFALYKSPTPICPVASIGPTDAIYMDLNANVYCLVEVALFEDQADNGIPAGHSVTLTMDAPVCQTLDNITGGCGTVNAPPNEEPFDYLAADAQPASACTPSDTLGWIIASTVPITSCN